MQGNMWRSAVLLMACLTCVHMQIDDETLSDIFGKPSAPVNQPVSNTNPEDIDDGTLTDIFGTPAPPVSQPVSAANLEDITVRPTDSSATFTDQNGDSCKCLPYYLCDGSRTAVHMNNVSVTGWGTLDVRFGEEDECQESIEICCKVPLDSSSAATPPTPAPPTPAPPPDRGCGYRNPGGLDFSLTGGSGTEAGFGEYPWVVAVLDNDNEYQGVGVLIHPSVVMTGAHIAIKVSVEKLKVRAGEWDTQTRRERLPHQERLAAEVVLHEDFRSKTLWNDMALIKLESPVELASHINVLCMPQQGDSFDTSRQCVANGWGSDVFGLQGRYAVIIKRVEVDMVPHGECNRMMKRTKLGPRFHLHSSFVCAGGREGIDTCKGDGGAPLACPIGQDRYKLAGLVAWGIGCAQQGVPAAYVNVAMFRHWVDDKMADWGYQLENV